MLGSRHEPANSQSSLTRCQATEKIQGSILLRVSGRNSDYETNHHRATGTFDRQSEPVH